MFQKIVSAILSISLLFSSVTWAEEEKAPFTTYVNGEKIEAKDPIWMDSYDVVPYAAIARKLGYTVTYDETENKVISQKDNTVITFVPGDYRVQISNQDSQWTEYIGPSACEFDGTVYLSKYSFYRLFHVSVSVLSEQREVHVITQDAVAALIREKAEPLKIFLETEKMFENFRSDFTFQSGFSGKSELFGIGLDGNSNSKFTLQKQGRTFYASVKLENSGLYNFYNLGLTDMLTDSEGNPDSLVGKPVKLEFFLDDGGLYVKAGALSMEVVRRYVSSVWYIKQEVLDKCSTFVKDKWIFFPFNEEKKQEFSFLFDGQYADYEQWVDVLSSNIFDSGSHQSYQDFVSDVEKISELWDSNHLSVADIDGKRTVTYHLNKTVLKSLLKATRSSFYVYQEDALKDAFPLLTFDLRFDSVSDKTFQTEQILLIELSLSNFPNEWGLECGTLQYKLSGRNTIKEGVQNINCPDPSQTVSNEEILKLLNEETDEEKTNMEE